MTTLHIHVPDDHRARLAARAANNGFESLEQYAEALLRADADDQPQVADPAFKEELIRRVQDPRPDLELTPQLRESLRAQLRPL